MQQDKIVNNEDFLSEMYKKFNIVVEEVYKDNVKAKPIPKEWVTEIVKQIIIDTKVKTNLVNYQNELYQLIFDSEEDRIVFDTEFVKHMPKTINTFIESKNENPKDYNRALILECKEDKQRLTIQW